MTHLDRNMIAQRILEVDADIARLEEHLAFAVAMDERADARFGLEVQRGRLEYLRGLVAETRED